LKHFFELKFEEPSPTLPLLGAIKIEGFAVETPLENAVLP
jgi:hypothetical protein